MFLVAARTLAANVSAQRIEDGALYPPLSGLRPISRAIAVAVAREARDSGLARIMSDEQIEMAVDAAMWTPDYAPYTPPNTE
jgi:malic enzyme